MSGGSFFSGLVSVITEITDTKDSPDTRTTADAGPPPGRCPFTADWVESSFLHLACEPARLARALPPGLDLDLLDGLAIVSLVAFRQERLRPAAGGRVTEWLARPLANHEFLNVRAYVRGPGGAGIYFLAEWIPNRLAAWIGPRLYGLPYRLGRLAYECRGTAWRGRVEGREGGRLEFTAAAAPGPLLPARPGSPAAFLLERYRAFTWRRGVLRRFHVAHPPWPQVEARVEIGDRSLLAPCGVGLERARLFGAHVSPGVRGVRIGPPERPRACQWEAPSPRRAP